MLANLFKKKSTNTPKTSPSEAEVFLTAREIDFEKKADGTLVVDDSLYVAGLNLDKLPDLTNVIVNGRFSCSHNNLTSLVGAPQQINGDIFCHQNNLISLREIQNVEGEIYSDFGTFNSVADIPENLLIDFEKVARQERQQEKRQKQQQAILDGIENGLKNPLKIRTFGGFKKQ